jgi:hypothetical protein
MEFNELPNKRKIKRLISSDSYRILNKLGIDVMKIKLSKDPSSAIDDGYILNQLNELTKSVKAVKEEYEHSEKKEPKVNVSLYEHFVKKHSEEPDNKKLNMELIKSAKNSISKIIADEEFGTIVKDPIIASDNSSLSFDIRDDVSALNLTTVKVHNPFSESPIVEISHNQEDYSEYNNLFKNDELIKEIAVAVMKNENANDLVCVKMDEFEKGLGKKDSNEMDKVRKIAKLKH